MSDTLEIQHAGDGWVLVNSEEKGRHYAAEVMIAGNEIDFSGTDSVTVNADTWAIQCERYPALLIEAPQYYSGEGSNEESDQDLVFFTDE